MHAQSIRGLCTFWSQSALLILCLTFLPLPPALAKGETPANDKTALVLATFGSTVPQKEDPLGPVKEEMAKRFPQLPVFVAHTSVHVMKRLRAQGIEAKSLNQTLADLAASGYERVVVQSLHVTPGKEYDLVNTTAGLYPGLPKGGLKTRVGLPLIGGHADAEALAALLASGVPAAREAADAVIFVGHGAENPVGSLAYPALQAFLWQQDPAFFVGTVEGPYDAATVAARVKTLAAAQKTRRVWLVPLLTILGDHAQNDVFGTEEGSWKHALQAAGFEVLCQERGLFALPGVARLFADHAETALKALDAAAGEAVPARAIVGVIHTQ